MNQTGPETPRGLMGWCLHHPKSTLAIVLFLVALLLFYLLDRNTRGGLARRIAAIRARGEPVTIEDLIALQSKVPDSENRIAGIIPHATAISNYKEKHSDRLPLVGTRRSDPTGVPWPDEVLAETKDWLTAVEPDLQKLHDALQRNECVLNIPWSSPAINFVLPEMSYLRLASSALALETLYAAERGDVDRVVKTIQQAFRLLCFSRRDAPLLLTLVETGCQGLLLDTIERVVNRVPLSDAELSQWQSAIARMEECIDLRQVLLVERCLYLDLMLPDSLRGPAAAPAPGNPGATDLGSKLIYSVPPLRAMEINEFILMYDELLKVIEQPMETWIAGLKRVNNSPNQIKYFAKVAYSLQPTLSHVIKLQLRYVGKKRSMEVALAAERYRLAEGQWPADVATLVPKYLDRVPVDPVDGQPIRYAIFEEGIKTWTICDDANNQDDGGDVKRREVLKSQQRPLDHGWVILNPNLRGQPMPATTQVGK